MQVVRKDDLILDNFFSTPNWKNRTYPSPNMLEKIEEYRWQLVCGGRCWNLKLQTDGVMEKLEMHERTAY